MGKTTAGLHSGTYDELVVHLCCHEDQALLFLQVRVVVQDQLTGSVLAQHLDTNEKVTKKMATV